MTSGFSVDAPASSGYASAGPQVREEAELAANAEDALLRAHLPRQRVVFRAADGAQQHRIGRARQRERRGGQWRLCSVVTRAADRRRFRLDRQSVALQHAHDLLRLGDDLGADAVTGENGDLHGDSGEPGVLRKMLRLERADLVRAVESEADFVEAVLQAMLAERVDLEAEHRRPVVVATVCFSRSTVSRNPGSAAVSWNSRSTSCADSTTGSRPFFRQF